MNATSKTTKTFLILRLMNFNPKSFFRTISLLIFVDAFCQRFLNKTVTQSLSLILQKTKTLESSINFYFDFVSLASSQAHFLFIRFDWIITGKWRKFSDSSRFIGEEALQHSNKNKVERKASGNESSEKAELTSGGEKLVKSSERIYEWKCKTHLLSFYYERIYRRRELGIRSFLIKRTNFSVPTQTQQFILLLICNCAHFKVERGLSCRS